MQGIFGDMFDLDGNGDLDIFEQAAELCFLDEISMEEHDELDDFENLDEFDDDYF